MLCPKCGARLPLGSTYCRICGVYIENFKTGGISLPGCRQKNRYSPNTFFIALLSVAFSLVIIIIVAMFANSNLSPDTSSAVSAVISGDTTENSFHKNSFSALFPSSASFVTEEVKALDIPKFDPAIIDDLIMYFNEIALKSEYGSSDEDMVKRWEKPIRIEISGSYTDEDYATLLKYIETLKSLKCLPDIQIVQYGSNYAVHFVPLSQMPDIIPGYVNGNWGYITLDWNDTCQIESAVMGVCTDVTNQLQRNHLILEEFTQGLGLLNDSTKYPDSIFQIEWTEVQDLNEMDYEIIKMLYSPVVHAGMQKEEADNLLKQWLSKNRNSFFD